MKYIVLLRGINVGGNNKVAMMDLKQVFERLGFSNVSTYINSGNVIFEALEKPDSIFISNTLSKAFGFTMPTLVIDADLICNLVALTLSTWTNDDMQKNRRGIFME